MASVQSLIQQGSRTAQRHPDRFLATAVLLFYGCGMGFALLLAMILAGLTHDVFASFNVSIGVLLGAFGYGLLRRMEAGGDPVILLLKLLLAFAGGGALAAFYLKATDFGALNVFWHVCVVYALVAALGHGTGRAVRLFQAVSPSRGQPRGINISAAGAGGVSLGALCFAFLFYSRWGVITSLLAVAGLSSLSALCLAALRLPLAPPGGKPSAVPWARAHLAAFLILLFYSLSHMIFN